MYDENRERLRQHEIEKVNRAAKEIMRREYVSSTELEAIFKESGVARTYFDQMYELEFVFIWEKEGTLEWKAFLKKMMIAIKMHDRLYDDVLAYDKLSMMYRLNERTGMVDVYNQEWRYKIAFKKRNTLNLAGG